MKIDNQSKPAPQNPPLLHIDGSYGEGGGQILRTSLSLAAIANKPITIHNIRANRKTPGLAAQHLTSVRAAGAICNAEIRGDTLGSTTLEFIPGSTVQPGNYTFDVMEARPEGSAGAIALVLQTVLLPLARVSGNSQVTLRGGTWMPMSPPYPYIEQVYVPMLQKMGIEAEVEINAWGWFPIGQGEINLSVNGNTKPLNGIQLMERGDLKQVQGIALATELPSHIPQRMASRAENLLRDAGIKPKIEPKREKAISKGVGIFLAAEYENSLAGFGALGRIGLAAENVAEAACEEFFNFDKTRTAVDEHLADQLLLPAALASTESQYRVALVSLHLTTNAWVVEQFEIAKVKVDRAEKIVTVTPFI